MAQVERNFRRGRFAKLALCAALALTGACSDAGAGRGEGDSKGGGERGAPRPRGPIDVLSGDTEVTSHAVPSVFDHAVPITIHRPIEATAGAPVPVIVHSHSWAESRTSAPDAFRRYARAGFGVVSIDMRGHGDARLTSEAHVDHVDYEIRDVSAVLDHLAALDWVELDAPGDPRVGAMGGAYGGGFQLLSAARDGRLDALVPESTWNDLPQSLAPNGAPKSLWIDSLYAAGVARARLHPDVHQGLLSTDVTNEVPDGADPALPNLVAQFTASSPASYARDIRVPTLLTQGANDTLFSVNEAAANFAQIAAWGGETKLVTHLGGHLLPGQRAGASPCGDLDDLTIAWHQAHLRRMELDLGPRVCLALEDGTAITGDAFPPANVRPAKHALEGATTLTQLVPQREEFVVLRAERETVLAGIPVLRARATLTGPDAILYVTLVVESADGEGHVVNAQVTPARLPRNLDGSSLELPLMAIATRLALGDTLSLRVSTVNEQYLHNAGRVPGVVRLEALEITLPVLEE